jgi:hypothetical protein
MIVTEYEYTKGRFMKPVLKLLIASLVLLTHGFAQEPKKAIVPHDSAVMQSRDQIIASGSAKQPAPVVQPKALPALSPSLGDIARAARAAHAAAPKAQVVVAEDAPSQK